MNKVLLLDFDGVVFRHKSANIVSNKAARYVKNHLKTTNRDSHIINKYLYKSFGHTATGLSHITKSYITKPTNDTNISIEDYNKFVYNDIDYKRVFSNTTMTQQGLEDIKDINNILDHCTNHNIVPCIFSNAPPIWYKNILDCMEIDKNQFKYINIYNTYNTENLKPNENIYKEINYIFKDHKLYFVDDSFVNFIHTLSNPRWVNIMFDKKPIMLPGNSNSNINLKIISELKDIIKILDE